MNKLNRTGLFLFGVLLFVCAGNLHAQQAMSLDGVIAQAAKDVEARISAGAKLAVLNFTSTTEAFSDYVIEELSGALVMNRKVMVIERKSLDLIRKEMNLQMSGDVSDDSAQAIGRQLGAQAIVTGSLTNLGDTYRFRVKVINVETARIEAQFSYNLGNNQQVAFLLNGNQQNAPPVAQAPTESSARVYGIGDTGPAGGLIFYDKGNNSGGWRYLEAAPVSTEFKVPWGADKANINTDTDIGSGKRNTEIIVRFLWDNGQNGAALLCDELSINGFNDWFLPSKGELNLMYMRLKLKALGNFRQNWYWSSSKDSGRLVWVQTFSDGKQWDSGYYYADDIFVRAIRQF